MTGIEDKVIQRNYDRNIVYQRFLTHVYTRIYLLYSSVGCWASFEYGAGTDIRHSQIGEKTLARKTYIPLKNSRGKKENDSIIVWYRYRYHTVAVA